MEEAYLCDGIRTPIGRYGGVLSKLRTDDLASIPIKKLIDPSYILRYFSLSSRM